MTINEALSRASELMGGHADRSMMLEWLNEIEHTVCSEIAATHEGAAPNMSPITAQTDGDRVLFVPDPDAQLYILYLVMKNDLYLRDTEQYANSSAAFQAAYSTFADRYNREKMPLSVGSIRL